MFVDEVTITIVGGNGGRGCVSFQHEKFKPRAGPDGGDGGEGGDVLLRANPNTDTLSAFAGAKVFRAERGALGRGKHRTGRSGADLVLAVPPGTVVTDAASGEHLADLEEADAHLLVARGGRGGYGNAHFTSSTRQAPDFAELGEPGEERRIRLELKLVADVGIIGEPNVGKSTLISVISSAKPKIADYPFTTLVPNLGVVGVGSTHDRRSFVVCDVPGLIEGASEGKGLGHQFLRHMERCGVVLHLLDVSRSDLVKDYRDIRRELERYSPRLAEKREIVVLSKIDLQGNDVRATMQALEREGISVFAAISAVTHAGVREMLQHLLPIVLEERGTRATRKEEEGETIPVLRPHLEGTKMGAFVLDVTPGPDPCRPQAITVRGKRIEQFAVMTNFSQPGAARRFRDVCERCGLRSALLRSGATSSTPVSIGRSDVTGKWQ